MSLDDWILALHLLSAFALVGSIVVFWLTFAATRAADSLPRVASVGAVNRVAAAAVALGAVGTLVFGVWLAISLDAYRIWDGWVIAAIVLWAIGTETGRRVGTFYQPHFGDLAGRLAAGETALDAEQRAVLADRRPLVLHAVSSVATLLVLLDMLWKPGA